MIKEILEFIKDYFSKLRFFEQEKDDLGFARQNKTDGAEKVKRNQRIMFLFLIGGLVCAFILIINLLSSGQSSSSTPKQNADNNLKGKNLKLEVASNALDPEKMWRNHFEDKLDNTKNAVDESIGSMKEVVSDTEARLLQKTAEDIAEIGEQLRIAKEDLDSAMNEIRLFREEQAQEKQNNHQNLPTLAEISAFEIEQAEQPMPVKSTKNYIPETGYLKGVLLGGISVSTSMGSQQEPVPVVIRITEGGNLPKNFEVNLKQCRILGSSYGDLSSERAVIRLETMVCEDKELEQIVTTKIAGIVYGDDGMNGIKGKIVQTSNKLLKNAIVGGMLSGLSQNMQGQGQMAITSLGALSTQKQGVSDTLKNSSLSGASNASEKIADYYLKQAESMSPVLLIAGGSKVDIVFTKGVTIGSGDVKEKIAHGRKSSAEGQGNMNALRNNGDELKW